MKEISIPSDDSRFQLPNKAIELLEDAHEHPIDQTTRAALVLYTLWLNTDIDDEWQRLIAELGLTPQEASEYRDEVLRNESTFSLWDSYEAHLEKITHESIREKKGRGTRNDRLEHAKELTREGFTRSEIAARLGVSTRTISRYHLGDTDEINSQS